MIMSPTPIIFFFLNNNYCTTLSNSLFSPTSLYRMLETETTLLILVE